MRSTGLSPATVRSARFATIVVAAKKRRDLAWSRQFAHLPARVRAASEALDALAQIKRSSA